MKTLKILGLVFICFLLLTANMATAFAASDEGIKETGPTILVSEVAEEVVSPIPALTDEELPVNETQAVEETENSTDASLLISILTPELKEVLIRSVITEDEEKRIAQTVYGEDRQNNLMRRAAVIWCIFNRIDSPSFADTVDKVVTSGAFHGYFPGQSHPQWAHDLVRDVALRWALEKAGYTNVGRVLPAEYCFFAGSGGVNRFRTGGGDGYWAWTLTDPYKGAYSFEELAEIEAAELQADVYGGA